KYGVPGKNHEFLKRFVGAWDLEVKAWMQPGAQPMMSKGMMNNELIFDGRFIRCEFEGTMMGQPFKGLEIIGYDLFQNKYITLWIDNSSTAFFLTTGTLDASGKVLTDTGTWPDAMTGGTSKVKNLTTIIGPDKYMFEMFMMMPDGKEFKYMEFVATPKMMS
ncbi:MAG: DUF1579 domain-containing protein, partial [Acidobacteriota bacterium]